MGQDKFLNFSVEKSKVIWRKSYPVEGVSIKGGLLQATNIRNVVEDHGIYYAELSEFTVGKEDLFYSGKVMIAADSSQYIVEVKGFTWHIGGKRATSLALWTGVQGGQSATYVGDAVWIKKDGRIKDTGRSHMTSINPGLEEIFSFR